MWKFVYDALSTCYSCHQAALIIDEVGYAFLFHDSVKHKQV